MELSAVDLLDKMTRNSYGDGSRHVTKVRHKSLKYLMSSTNLRQQLHSSMNSIFTNERRAWKQLTQRSTEESSPTHLRATVESFNRHQDGAVVFKSAFIRLFPDENVLQGAAGLFSAQADQSVC